jgi:cytochrome c oxidase assembly protein subunit 15
MRLRFRHLAASAAALSFALILLGVYTGASGAGLACEGRWPLCDGFLGLFPANWPSFVEWLHRFVAMITGFVVLGTAVAAYRGDHDRRILFAMVVAVAVLPVQILLGANTVFNFGIPAQVLHHGAAQVIFGALVAAAAWADAEAGGDGSAPAD